MPLATVDGSGGGAKMEEMVVRAKEVVGKEKGKIQNKEMPLIWETNPPNMEEHPPIVGRKIY